VNKILESQYEMFKFNKKENVFSKKNIRRWLKFYLIPGWKDPEIAEIEGELERSTTKRRLFRRFLAPLTLFGFLLVLFIIFLAIYAPWLTPYTLYDITQPTAPAPGSQEYAPPSPEHPLGTTEFTYDLLGRLIWGSRTALTVGLIPVLIAILGGTIIGTLVAYRGGLFDSITMRTCDLIFAFPNLLLVILIIPIIGYELEYIMLIYGILLTPFYIRLMRSSVLQKKQDLYVESAKIGGADNFKIMFKHILPNAISPMIIAFFGMMGRAILGFSSLAFLGMSEEYRIADWGTDIFYGRTHYEAPWASIFPAVMIGIAVVGFMLIGDGLRDVLDPKYQK